MFDQLVPLVVERSKDRVVVAFLAVALAAGFGFMCGATLSARRFIAQFFPLLFLLLHFGFEE